MLAYIKGNVTEIGVDRIVVETGGVGFEIATSSMLSAKLSKNQDVKIHTYLNVREDDMSLFGFWTKEEKEIFKMLINVSGVGPKSALSILSCLSVEELRMAVLSDDHKAIAKANGIGPKTAQRLVIELRDKFHLEDVFEDLEGDMDKEAVASQDVISETAMALSSLGYSNVEALRAIKKVPGSEGMGVEELLKAALKQIGL